MNNVILIGMPACGKSTVGVLLAKALCMDFCDTDLVFQKSTGYSLCDYISTFGSVAFIKEEEQTVLSLDISGSVIATGGSVVYGKDAMKRLKENGVTVYIKAPLSVIKSRINNINTRGVVLTHGNTLDDIFSERIPLYEKYADITVDSTSSAEECVESIVSALKRIK